MKRVGLVPPEDFFFFFCASEILHRIKDVRKAFNTLHI